VQLPDAIEVIRPSVVQISAMGPATSPQGDTLGTGFLVTPQVVVTAKHVVDAVDEASGQALHVAFAGPEVDTPELKIRAGFVGTGGRILAVMPEHDLALVEAPGAAAFTAGVRWGPSGVVQPSPTPAQLSNANVREGTQIAVSGYPLNEPSLVTNSGILASSFSLVEDGGGLQERHLGDFTANPGNSGGPVYTVADAAVVGVCVAGKLAPIIGGVGAHAAGLTVIVPVAEVVSLLERQGVSIENLPAARKASRQRKKRRKR
jgi:S1-C subfamily serine protease